MVPPLSEGNRKKILNSNNNFRGNVNNNNFRGM
jgi:hypothetical protein